MKLYTSAILNKIRDYLSFILHINNCFVFKQSEITESEFLIIKEKIFQHGCFISYLIHDRCVVYSKLIRSNSIFKTNKNYGIIILFFKNDKKTNKKVRVIHNFLFKKTPYDLRNKFADKFDNMVGNLVGYPQCCIDKFIQNIHHNNKLYKHFGITYKNGERRLGHLSYIPCSINCKESNKRQDKIINFHKKLITILKKTKININ